jgi:hypothetical protein
MEVLVKYCGGCNAGYDRVAFVENLRTAFPEAGFSHYDEAPVVVDSRAFVLAVCGCPVRCTARALRADAVAYRKEDFEAVTLRMQEPEYRSSTNLPGERRNGI